MQQVYKFGENRNLVGILSRCEASEQRLGQLGILILNSGLVHRAGPFRLNAELSQYLAAAGFDVFRFDLSGIGDSEIVVNDSRPYKQRFCDDIGEAIDFLEHKHGIRSIVVLGLCTGAELAYIAAVNYPQVIGNVLLDGYGYPNYKFLIRRYGPALLNPKRIFRTGINITRSLVIPASDSGDETGYENYLWELPDKQEYIDQMNGLHERQVKQLYIYSGGVDDYYNYEYQYYDVFRDHAFMQDVTVRFFKNADHTFIILEQRRRMFESVLAWLNDVLVPAQAIVR